MSATNLTQHTIFTRLGTPVTLTARCPGINSWGVHLTVDYDEAGTYEGERMDRVFQLHDLKADGGIAELVAAFNHLPFADCEEGKR